ncbi:hypothetical protein [Neisseria dumasiana]|uniref:hypothetical protein n=1 Tax=Neisseria dumasiana TaxID=1931275 RepID=UPI000F7838A6|nr:hypothetical protein [Neisseria dumasiana]
MTNRECAVKKNVSGSFKLVLSDTSIQPTAERSARSVMMFEMTFKVGVGFKKRLRPSEKIPKLFSDGLLTCRAGIPARRRYVSLHCSLAAAASVACV